MQADAIAKGRGIGLLPTWFANGFETAHPGSLIPCVNGWQSQPTEINCFYPLGRHPLRCAYLLMRSAKQGPMSGNKKSRRSGIFYHRFFFA